MSINWEMLLMGLALAGAAGRLGWLLACRSVIADTTAIQDTLIEVHQTFNAYEKSVEEERVKSGAVILKLVAEVERLSLALDEGKIETK